RMSKAGAVGALACLPASTAVIVNRLHFHIVKQSQGSILQPSAGITQPDHQLQRQALIPRARGSRGLLGVDTDSGSCAVEPDQFHTRYWFGAVNDHRAALNNEHGRFSVCE